MFKLVMNSLSHTEEIAKTSLNFFDDVSIKEQHLIAKEVIVFLYLIDNNHIMSHLSQLNLNNKNLKETLERWVGDIRKLSK